MNQLKVVQVEGDNSDFLSIKLVDILDCIENVNELKWFILRIEARGVSNSDISIIDLEDKLNSAENHTLLSLEELNKLSSELEQIIDLTLIGDIDSDNLKRYADEWEMFSNCNYTIQLVDSSYWIICCKNNRTLENIDATLQGVKHIDISTLPH